LTEEASIAKYFKESPEEEALVFDFHGQWKLFKRFPVHDPARQLIVTKFVNALVTHPRANELTGINMANTGCGDDFIMALGDQFSIDDTSLLNLQMVQFETNFINEAGVVALSHLIASPSCCASICKSDSTGKPKRLAQIKRRMNLPWPRPCG
jgi:hypothetical protein